MKKALCAAAVVLALCLLAGTAWSTGSYTTGDAPAAIPDNSPGTFACQSVTVPAGEPGGDNITAITVTIGIDHSWVGDGTLQLTGPNCGPLFLYAKPGAAGGAGFGDSSDLCAATPLTLDDGAGTSAEAMGGPEGAAACVGTVGPTSYSSDGDELGGPATLSTCLNTDAVGSWMLCIDDNAGGDTGTLQTWTLDITTDPVELQEFSVD